LPKKAASVTLYCASSSALTVLNPGNGPTMSIETTSPRALTLASMQALTDQHSVSFICPD
jgi:hypothetical protein